MKYENRLSYLNAFLNVVLVVLTLPVIAAFYVPFNTSINMKDMIFQLIVELSFLGGYIIIILTLKKILKSIRVKDPFNPNNIKHFKKIGYYILFIGLIYAFINYPKPDTSNLEIMATSYGSLKPTFFLYIVLSLFSFIMSDVFRMAMEIKDENDLTV